MRSDKKARLENNGRGMKISEELDETEGCQNGRELIL